MIYSIDIKRLLRLRPHNTPGPNVFKDTIQSVKTEPQQRLSIGAATIHEKACVKINASAGGPPLQSGWQIGASGALRGLFWKCNIQAIPRE